MNMTDMITTERIQIDRDVLVINKDARDWCNLEYHNHPNGCPNYGECDHCPPQAPEVDEWIDLDRSMWLIVAEFNIGTYIEHMNSEHPEWSIRQKKNPLYWQSSVEKELREEFKKLKRYVCTNVDNFNGFCNDKIVATLIPEAMGVHVFMTMRRLSYDIKPDPDEIAYKVALAGIGDKSTKSYLKK